MKRQTKPHQPPADKELYRLLRDAFPDHESCMKAVKEAQQIYARFRRQMENDDNETSIFAQDAT